MIDASFALVKLATLLLALVVASLAFRGYRRSGQTPMLYVAVGFVFIGAGAVCEGLIYLVFDTSLLSAALVQAAVVSCGLLCILASLVLGRSGPAAP